LIYYAALQIPPLWRWAKSDKVKGKRAYHFHLIDDAGFGIHPTWKREGRRTVFVGYHLVLWPKGMGGPDRNVLGEYRTAAEAVKVARGVWERELESRYF
jgi:hypothetical protein